MVTSKGKNMSWRFFLSAIAFLTFTSVSFASKGIIVKERYDKYIIAANLGYVLCEWYGGCQADEGDYIVGDFESYGFKDVFNITKDDEMHIYVEDYWENWENALEWLYE